MNPAEGLSQRWSPPARMGLMRPVISILCSEMDGTPLIRDHALARMLQDQFEVHVVGFSQSGEVWGPLANEAGMDYRPYSAPTAMGAWRGVPDLTKAIEGRVLTPPSPAIPPTASDCWRGVVWGFLSSSTSTTGRWASSSSPSTGNCE